MNLWMSVAGDEHDNREKKKETISNIFVLMCPCVALQCVRGRRIKGKVGGLKGGDRWTPAATAGLHPNLHRKLENFSMRRKSEFLGCVSLAVKNAIKKEISGSFRLVAQGGGSKASNHQQSVQSSPGPSTFGSQSMMARHSGNARFEEVITLDEESNSSPEKHGKLPAKKKLNDESSFLRHLELEPLDGDGGRLPYPEAMAKGGRTPFTTTKQLTKQPGVGFGFSIAWVQPPRVERVEAGQPADRAGIRPGDFVVFVDRYNVVTMSEEQILQIIKSCGNELTLEIYRKSNQNGVVEPPPALPCPAVAPAEYNPPTRWSTACSAATSASLDFTKRRLHLPQVAFTNEVGAGVIMTTQLNPEESRKKAVYQLLNKEQNYAMNLQFGINRFLVPLTEKREFLNPAQHHVLFQNIEEILRLTEENLDQIIQGELDAIVNSIGSLYYKNLPNLKVAYRRYCTGIKRADCLLAEKSKNTEFNRFCAEPAIPRKRPDLTTFLHKPLEHYRELLKLLQTILNKTKPSDVDHPALSKVVADMQATFREVTAGLMEPDVDGRPLLSVQDLESRLVFTRCKPFVLSIPGRQWIFGGDLSRVEGRAVHPFWALLFTDMMVFAKVSRDRVLFITEEPLSLLAVSQAFFNIRKRANEFRLLLSSTGSGTDSPANAMCGPDIALSRTPKKNTKFRSVALRAPTPELKAVWQNLIQRQIIYLNTTRGLTPAGSPLDSPDPLTNLSAATGDSFSAKRQVRLPQHHTCSPHHISRSDHEQTPTPPLDQGQYQLLLTPESASTSDAFPYEKEALSDSQ
ncbi:hypothetical protein RUM43_011151 [Polyplax serrata]|uniref:DH domain-containing protein n=1 Tax=Polyplax serrata TaxID=468196 RepID=A0AAN8NXY9_POLSC